MAALMMSLKQPSWIYCTCLWLAALAVVNAQEVLQPTPDKLQILNEDTKGNTKYPALTSETIEVSALGRPLFPGMLYDCRKDTFIPGVTLWDKKSLSEDLDTRQQPMMDLKFSSSDSLSIPDPKTRDDFLQYSLRLNPDLNTVNKRLLLSERKREITLTHKDKWYPDHPDRFKHWPQVLCSESVTGRSYWEIEWSGGLVSIAVSYKNISRKGHGHECWFGGNDQSWSLRCSPDRYSFRHNNIKTELPVKPISSRTGVYGDIYRVGVYVDHSAGTLSFYSVSGDTMILIHTVQTTFTQPLYPGFAVYSSGSSVKLC